MKPAAQITFAERAGRTLGQMWRAGTRLERKVCTWLVAQGLGTGLVKGVLWVVKLAVLAILLYAAFWLALLLVFAVAAAWAASNVDGEAQQRSQWANDEEEDHRKSVFYHPLSHNDPPDPRFEDD